MDETFAQYVLQIFYAIMFVLAVSALIMLTGLMPGILSGGRQALDTKLSVTEKNTEMHYSPEHDEFPKITASDVYYDIMNSDATIPVLIYRGTLLYDSNGDVTSNITPNISTGSIRAFQEGEANIVKGKLTGTTENTLFEKRYKKSSNGEIICIVYVQV